METNRQIWWWAGGAILVVVVVGIYLASNSKPGYIAPETETERAFKGSPQASLVLQEYSDFQCPACKSAHTIVKDVVDTFGDRLYFQYRHYPLVTIHTQAFRAALASECAQDQGKFWEYHDLLFDNQPNFSRDDLVAYAQQLSLVVEGESGFAACLDARAKTDMIRQDMRDGDQLGVKGTPTFFLNGEIVQDWPQLKSIIQAKMIGG